MDIIVDAIPPPKNGGFSFLITEILDLHGKTLYPSYEVSIPADAVRFIPLEDGGYFVHVNHNFKPRGAAQDLMVYPRF